MAEKQLARGLWSGFAATENPFGTPNGMDENLRTIDDHLALYTLYPPMPAGGALPVLPENGDGQIFSDGSYAVYNAGEWRFYGARPGILVMAKNASETWQNTGAGWIRATVLDTQPAIDAAIDAVLPLVERAENAAMAAALGIGTYYSEIDDGRAAVADGESFWVEPTDFNGLTRFTMFKRTSESTQEKKYEVVSNDDLVAVSSRLNAQQSQFYGAGAAVWSGSSTGVAAIIVHNPLTQQPLVYVDLEGQLKYRGQLTSDFVSEIVDSEFRNFIGGSGYMNQKKVGRYRVFRMSRDFRIIDGWDLVENKPVGLSSQITQESVSRSPESPLPEEERVPAADIVHDLAAGESLSVGASQPKTVITTTQPYSNVTFTNGPRSPLTALDAFIPLAENGLTPAPDSGSGRGETACSAASNRVVELAAISAAVDPAQNIRLGSTAGLGGARVANVMGPSGWYALTEAMIQAGFSLATAQGKTYAIHAVQILIGSNDAYYGTSYEAFIGHMSTWRQRIENSYHSITGRTNKIKFLLLQPTYKTLATDSICRAIYDLCDAEPENFTLVCPSYMLPYDGASSNVVHLDAHGYIRYGLLAARHLDAIGRRGVRPKWIRLRSTTSRGNVVTATFDVPVQPLFFDIVNLAATTDYGFQIRDEHGLVEIAEITIGGGNSVVLALARSLTENPVIRYGLDYLGTGLRINEGSSGNLRDSEHETVEYAGMTHRLFNSCPAFERNIIKLSGI